MTMCSREACWDAVAAFMRSPRAAGRLSEGMSAKGQVVGQGGLVEVARF